MKFCFLGNISGVLNGKTIGGGELQIYLLAKSLALKGHEVVIIDPFLDKSFCSPEGIKLINIPEWNKGVKFIRLFTIRIPVLWKMLKEQKADYYYVRMRSYLHLLPYYASRKVGGKFIQAIAHDLDILSIADKIKYEYKQNFSLFRFITGDLPNDLVLKFLLRKSDYVTLQHSGQAFSPGSSKSRQVLFPNIIDSDNFPVTENASKDYFIYVGSFTMLKGADTLQQLMNILDKNITVVIVGQPKGKSATKIYNELSKHENVIRKGRLDHNETIRYMSNAKALINTSYFEGFPNIYLEAWSLGIPVISLTVNPGNIFDKYPLGICCKSDLDLMKRSIETFDAGQFKKEELNAYIDEFHDFDKAAYRFLNALRPFNVFNQKSLTINY